MMIATLEAMILELKENLGHPQIFGFYDDRIIG